MSDAAVNIPRMSFGVYVFAFLWITYLELELSGHRICVCLALPNSCQCTPRTGGVGEFPLLQICANTWYFQSFKILTILVRMVIFFFLDDF